MIERGWIAGEENNPFLVVAPNSASFACAAPSSCILICKTTNFFTVNTVFMLRAEKWQIDVVIEVIKNGGNVAKILVAQNAIKISTT